MSKVQVILLSLVILIIVFCVVFVCYPLWANKSVFVAVVPTDTYSTENFTHHLPSEIINFSEIPSQSTTKNPVQTDTPVPDAPSPEPTHTPSKNTPKPATSSPPSPNPTPIPTTTQIPTPTPEPTPNLESVRCNVLNEIDDRKEFYENRLDEVQASIDDCVKRNLGYSAAKPYLDERDSNEAMLALLDSLYSQAQSAATSDELDNIESQIP